MRVFSFLFLGLLWQCGTSLAQNVNTLWYNKPATHFEEALVLGNGKTGATVFGGVLSDQVYLNDATLWSGEPVDPNMNPDAYKYYQPYHMVRPIPQTQVDAVTNKTEFTQNPGYQ